jgi:hypothetical protein
VDRPANAAEAEARFKSYVECLEAKASRLGVDPETADFVNHVYLLAERYGSHLFCCFDDFRIPSTTNELEGFFGRLKRFIRMATGCGSTTNALVQNLDDEFLILFRQAERAAKLSPESISSMFNLGAFNEARAAIDARELPARRRRSIARDLEGNLLHLFVRFEASL